VKILSQKTGKQKKYNITSLKFENRVQTHVCAKHYVSALGTNDDVIHDQRPTDDANNEQARIAQVNNDMQIKLHDVINLTTQKEGDSFNEAMVNYLQTQKLPNNNELAKSHSTRIKTILYAQVNCFILDVLGSELN